MRKLLIILLILLSEFTIAQQPFYGDRQFVSFDGNDTLWIEFQGDTIKLESTDSVWFNKLMNVVNAASISFGSDNEIPSTNSTTDDFDYSSNFTWNDTVQEINFGTNNVLIGQNAAQSITTNSVSCTFVGNSAGKITNGGDNNTFIGDQSGFSNITGANNTFVGRNSGRLNTASTNTFIGDASGSANTSGYNNTFVGGNSGLNNVAGRENVHIGLASGQNGTAGIKNTYIGYEAGKAATGTNNIFMGAQAGSNETGSSKLYIENSNSATPLIYGEFDNDIIKINGTQIQSTGTISDNDATPDVSAANIWTYNGTSNAVIVIDLDNPDVGAIYRIIGNSDTYTITINDAGNFNLSGNWVGGIDDILTIFVQADNDYIEISRSNN